MKKNGYIYNTPVLDSDNLFYNGGIFVSSKYPILTRIDIGSGLESAPHGLFINEVEFVPSLYIEDQSCPSYYNSEEDDFDSIYHLFGNKLEDFKDCEILN